MAPLELGLAGNAALGGRQDPAAGFGNGPAAVDAVFLALFGQPGTDPRDVRSALLVDDGLGGLQLALGEVHEAVTTATRAAICSPVR